MSAEYCNINKDLKKHDAQFIANTYARNDLALVNSKGCTAYDENGKEYLDFTSGIGVNSLGFCDANWVQAVCEQANKLQHISNLYYTQPCVQLAKTLCERTGMKKVFFANSGAEANECAVKLARKYSSEKYKEARHTIVTLKNSFHGRTIAMLKATGQDSFHKHFMPFPDGFVYADAHDFEDFLSVAQGAGGVCAVMLETVQGEGGVIPLTDDYLKKVAAWCKENDALLIVDEVQTGIGRTGYTLSCEHYGIMPDIVTLAKGLGGGLPIGAALMGEKVQDVFVPGDHGSTYGANPVACAGANAVMQTITDEFLQDVRAKGRYLKEEILKLPHVKSAEGLGLMLGITLEENIQAKQVLDGCMQNGLLCLTAKTKLRLLPPLTVSKEEIDKAVYIINKVLCSF